MSKEIVKVNNIHKTYQNGNELLEVLKGISFDVRKGEMLSIMGHSGSGKSTLLHILGAMDNASEGEIYLEGKLRVDYGIEPSATEIRAKNIGFIFQNFNLIADLSVEENVALPLMLLGKKNREVWKRTDEILEKVGIYEKKKNSVTELSGGQCQRVAIARALITEPKILLADEPTGNLDYNTAMDIMKLFIDLKQEDNHSIIIVTHDPVVASYADRILFLYDGIICNEYYCRNDENDIDNILEMFKIFQNTKEGN